jgi:hypothetical protein
VTRVTRVMGSLKPLTRVRACIVVSRKPSRSSWSSRGVVAPNTSNFGPGIPARRAAVVPIFGPHRGAAVRSDIERQRRVAATGNLQRSLEPLESGQLGSICARSAQSGPSAGPVARIGGGRWL